MDVEHILRVIKQGEGLTVEFKQANAFLKLRPAFQMSRNANKPHLYGSLAPSNCESFPKLQSIKLIKKSHLRTVFFYSKI